jgi:uncharacterized coiled-coil protein SlyX
MTRIAKDMTPGADIEEAPTHPSPDAVRLEAVEFKIAHLERAVQELSDVLYRQQQQLDATLAMNQRLRQQLEDIESRSGDPSASEIPPHY